MIHVLLSLVSLGGVGTLLDILVWLVGFFLVGLFASRQTGKVGTGTLAGLVTGLISGLIVVIFGIIQITANSPQLTQAINQVTKIVQQQGRNISSSEIRTIAVGGIVISLNLTVAFELGLGAGIGARVVWWDVSDHPGRISPRSRNFVGSASCSTAISSVSWHKLGPGGGKVVGRDQRRGEA